MLPLRPHLACPLATHPRHVTPHHVPFARQIFESNLTKATDNTPCSEQFTPTGGHYTNYSSTVTHGVPGLSITLDLYAPVGA